MYESLLERMFEPCGVYEVVREHGVIVDFERIFLNSAGRVVALTIGADPSTTSMVEEAPNVVEQGLFEQYVRVAETGVPWTGLSQPYSDDKRSVVLDIQAWRVSEGIAITYRDVTERERLGVALRESEELFRATVEGLPDAVSVLEAVREDGRIVDFTWTYVNRDGAALLGYPAEALIGARVLDLFPEQRGIGLIERYAEVVETGEEWRQPTVWIEDTWGDGVHRRRAFDIRLGKVGDGFVVSYREVTDVREATAEVVRLAGRLEDALADVPADDPAQVLPVLHQAVVLGRAVGDLVSSIADEDEPFGA